MIIFIAGLQAIPKELYEAARMEARIAGRRYVTWPLLAPAAAIIAYTTVQSFRHST